MWENPKFPADLVKFTKEILNGKLHFLCSEKEWLTAFLLLNESIHSPYLYERLFKKQCNATYFDKKCTKLQALKLCEYVILVTERNFDFLRNMELIL